MAAHWETGVVANTPTWHRLERAVLPEHITDWSTGLKEAGIDWEVYAEPVYVRQTGIPVTEGADPNHYQHAPDWQALRRDDNDAVLAIQPATYALVPIARFGEVIETIAGRGLKYEAIFSLYEGKMIVALLYFDDPLDIRADAGVTRTVSYLSMMQRFDGNGGVRGIPTNVRTICANTVNRAEALDGRELGFTIAHTANWEERVADAARIIKGARRDAQAWTVLANRLSVYHADGPAKARFLERFLPTATDMTERQVKSITESRQEVNALFASPTNRHVAGTGYGLVTAATEWADHGRAYRTVDSLVARQLVRKEPLKARAVRVACDLAGIKPREIYASVE